MLDIFGAFLTPKATTLSGISRGEIDFKVQQTAVEHSAAFFMTEGELNVTQKIPLL